MAAGIIKDGAGKDDMTANNKKNLFSGLVTGIPGFTLMELLVAMGILVILFAIAVPEIRSWLPNMRLKAAARDVYANLQKAKLEAVKRNVCVGIGYTKADAAQNGSYVLFVDDGNGTAGIPCNRIQDGSEATLSVVSMPVGVTLNSVSIGGASSSLCFNRNAVTCLSSQGNIQVKNQSRWYKITVSAAGGLRLETSTDGTHWKD